MVWSPSPIDDVFLTQSVPKTVKMDYTAMMKLDIATLAFIASLIFATETIAVFVQYRVNKTYRGPGWWLTGAVLQSLGFFFMLALRIPRIWMLAFPA
jgi:hypothetical protein